MSRSFRGVFVCGALLLCFVSMVAATAHDHEEEHEHHDDLFESLDTNGDGFLNSTEVSSMVMSYLNDPERLEEEAGGCANVTALVVNNDANGDGELDEDEAKGMAFDFLPCLSELTCAAEGVLHVTGLEGDGVESGFTCVAAGHGHDEHDEEEEEEEGEHHDEEEGEHHDEDEHDDHAVELTIGNVEWSCTEDVANEGDDDNDDGLSKGEAWALSMIGTTLITLLSLVGVLCMGKYLHLLYRHAHDIAAFAAGALLSGAFLHLLPEAAAEKDMDWKMAAVILAGFTVTMLVEQIIRLYRVAYGSTMGIDAHGHVHGSHGHGAGDHGTPKLVAVAETPTLPGLPADQEDGKHTPEAVVVDGEAVATAPTSPSGVNPTSSSTGQRKAPSRFMSKAQLMEGAMKDAQAAHEAGRMIHTHSVPLKEAHPIVWVILIGDFVHNFVDGVAIAAGFFACDASVGWSVVLAVALHELPAEIADFAILLSAGLSRNAALLFNFLSALGAFLGAFVVLGAEELSSTTNAYFLGLSAGVLIYIGATDLLPDIMMSVNVKKVAREMFLFLLAVGLVSLTLLHDKHCERGLDGSVHAHGH